ncbi:MAG: hypothetical protein ABR497_11130, partial [Kiritimatiellia bacterium]
RPCFATYLVFYLLLFIGAQMKGLTAVVIPILVVTPDLLFTGRWRHLLTPAHVAALVIGSLVYIVPFIYASLTGADYQSSGIALVIRENIQRYFDPFDHIEPFYAYFLHLPVLFMPWTPVLLLGFLAMVRRGQWRAYSWPSRWIGLAMILIFTFFSMSGSRRSYYILPILPFCALFSARWLLTLPEQVWPKITKILSVLLAIVTLALAAAGPLAVVYCRRLNIPLPIEIFWTLPACGLLVAAAWLALHPRIRQPRLLLGLPWGPTALLVTLAIGPLAYFCLVQPALGQYRPEKPFALKIKATGRQAGQVAFFGHYLENMVFYMDMQPPHKVIKTSTEAHAYLAADKANIIILRQGDLPVLLQHFPPGHQGGIYLSEPWQSWQNPEKQHKRRLTWSLNPPTATSADAAP